MLTSRLKSSELEVKDLQCQVVSYGKHLEVRTAWCGGGGGGGGGSGGMKVERTY